MPVRAGDFYSGYLKIEGFESVYNAIKQLPEEVGKGIVQKALMMGAEDVRAAITIRTPVGRTRNLRGSITSRWKNGRVPGWFQTMTGAGIQIDVGPEYSRAKKGYHGHLVEEGTKPHPIIAGLKYQTLKSGKVRLRETKTGALYDKKTGKWFGKMVRHPGSIPHPFVIPGFLASQAQALASIKYWLKNGIEFAYARMTSHG